MSSLASQLKTLSEKSSSIALNRQQRSKIHSRSLIFDPKVASTQDYEYIYEISLQGLQELCELDSRFNKFKASLFSQNSVNFDRNVQTQDAITHLDQNIAAFFTLLGPFYSFTSALKAAEWLVRRFQANIHNSEHIILTALPYYQHSVFIKILNVIPKQNFPPIFEWLVTFKDLLKCPTSQTIFRAFYNDNLLYSFYSSFLDEQVRNQTIYKNQLVFYLSITVQLIAARAKDNAILNETLIPVVLKTVDTILLSSYTGRSCSKSELILSAYSSLAVLSSVAPLSFEVLNTITTSILDDVDTSKPSLLKQTVTVLVQLWGSNSSAFETAPSLQRLKPNKEMLEVIKQLQFPSFKKDRFLASYFGNVFPCEQSQELLALTNVKDNASLLKFISQLVNDFILDRDITENRDIVVGIVKTLINANEKVFQEILFSRGVKISDLELKLQCTLSQKDNDSDNYNESNFGAVEDISTEAPIEEKVEKFDFNGISAVAPTYFESKNDLEFNQLSSVLCQICSSASVSSQRPTIQLFVHKVFQSSAAGMSFMIRVIFTQSIPLVIRLTTLRVISIKLKELDDGRTDFYLLLPLLLMGLSDELKSVRSGISNVIRVISGITTKLHKNKKTKTTLFGETEIYGTIVDKKILLPQDAMRLMEFLENGSFFDDVIFEKSKVTQMFRSIFEVKVNKKNFGELYEMFILNQCSLTFLPVVFKSKIWAVCASLNKNGGNERSYFWGDGGDVENYFKKRADWISQANDCKIDNFELVETSLVGLVGGGRKCTSEQSLKEATWLCQGLESSSGLQVISNDRILQVFEFLKTTEAKLTIVNKLLEMMVNDEFEGFDPMMTLQSLRIPFEVFLQALENVQIGDQMPEQGLVKRRRRSSNSTRQAMAKTDVNLLAALHIKKLSLLLEVLEIHLRTEPSVAHPRLLKVLFKILADLDSLGNDGNLPVLYTQELLATCMLLNITSMKKNEGGFKFDSNSVRADLIVNSIRSSSSPQVQNRLLLVISELAAFAPEIILHSVMPIFTFMGAHTIRQDDEFSNDALQKTVAKVIPALALNSSGSINSEIEFLLTSFTAAFQHIPSHRRAKLFVALTQTLKPSESMHLVIYLLGQQYSQASIIRKRVTEADDIVAFMELYLKTFSADDQLEGFAKFCDLLKVFPDHQLEPNSKEFDALRSRPIFGSSVISLTNEELIRTRLSLLKYFNAIIRADSSKYDILSLKSKIAMVLEEEKEKEEENEETKSSSKDLILGRVRHMTSFTLAELDTFSTVHQNYAICQELFTLLSNLLNLLPILDFVKSIVNYLDVDELRDNTSIKVAKNYAILSARKFENEISFKKGFGVIVEDLLKVLLKGISKNIDPELQQAYLNAFAIIVLKIDSSAAQDTGFITASLSSFLIEALGVITSQCGLLSNQTEIIIASISSIISVVKVLGIKTLGLFPKIITPTLKIWESTIESQQDEEGSKLIQEAVLLLLSCYIKKMPSFMVTSLDSLLLTALNSNLVENHVKSSFLNLIIERMKIGQTMKSLCNIWMNKGFYQNNNPASIGLFLNTMQSAIDKLEKSEAISQASQFTKWLINAFEFREYCQDNNNNNKFDQNTIHRIESSFHSCAIAYVMKLNDKSFRPLFASMVRWASTGEGGTMEINYTSRLLSFYRFFNKLQESLKSIVTSYYSYLIDTTSSSLEQFAKGQLKDTTLRRIILISLSLSFNFDQDEYWAQQGKFESICQPLLDQLQNIEDPIGKFLVKAISSLVSDVSSNEYNEIVLKGLIKFISYDNENSKDTKLWTIRVLKNIYQKLGERWLPYLPTLVPHVSELLEDDDEAVELEVREGLVRVIEKVLGEPLDRYLN
ncbi:UTP10 [Candida oxycetoniae]|uniref:U3 small nucleolar RNA-associated protein 10 n=1 Tax=Candida oxycetoniae TaxID=497107 RepID=A0AAI9WY79_9ASCO|nr:UTP10 [Candida oxycetoniae]KAI3404561.2 UTP10 [Candida oxycetoniae]